MAAAGRHLVQPVTGRDHRRGPDDAPVVIVEYGDYQDEHSRAVNLAVEKLCARLDDRLCFVYRHFPMWQINGLAERAAEAAEAAGEQGRFWEMHRVLYAHNDALEDGDLAGYAAGIGLDVPRFLKAVSGRSFEARVREDIAGGLSSGVREAPAFFLNGERYEGARDYETLLGAVKAKAPRPRCGSQGEG